MLVRIQTALGYMLVNPAQVTDIYFQFEEQVFLTLSSGKDYVITPDEATALVAALGGEGKPEPVVKITWIVSAERGETRNTRNPMWRCVTEDNERVNIFKHPDADKDNFRLFEAAGYGAQLDEIDIYATVDFDPGICITMQKNGQWWEIIGVNPSGVEPEHEACF